VQESLHTRPKIGRMFLPACGAACCADREPG
jgi:hypothetical protein